jgi:serine/threonine protein kinase
MDGYPEPTLRDGRATIGDTAVWIDNIRLDEYIGTGANAFVFAGQDLHLDRRVAVKIWAPRKRRGRWVVDRSDQALAEARKIAPLKDTRIASIYSVGRLPDSGWIYAIMEYIDGVVLKKIRSELDFQERLRVWRSTFTALDAAERKGAFHGDLHDSNVIVTNFLGDVTLIDFGTSILSGRDNSMLWHAGKVGKFATDLLPELKSFLRPFAVEDLVTPEYATIAVNQWVDSAIALQGLDRDLVDISKEDLNRRLIALADTTSSTHINIYEPVTEWLAGKVVSRDQVDIYRSAAKDKLISNLRRRTSVFQARPVPAVKSWIPREWLDAGS